MQHVRTASILIAPVLLMAVPARAAIVSADVAKSLEYQQTGATTVIPFNGGTNGFFYARTFFDNPADFDGGNVAYPAPNSPNSFNISGALDCCGHYGRGYQTGYITPAALDMLFPNGATYTLTATNSATMISQSVAIDYPYTTYASVLPALSAASLTRSSTRTRGKA